MAKREDEEETSEPAMTCGLGTWRPAYLQRLVNPKVFLFNLSLMAVIQGSYYSYMIGTTSTLEKRYAYSSRLTGFILIADNISSIIISPLIGFVGKHVNKSTLIAGGMMFVSASCWLTASPYLIYGPAGHLLHRDVNGSSSKFDFCTAGSDDSCVGHSGSTVWPAYVIIWLASFLNGIGFTAFYTLGYPYVDDNVSKTDAPIYISKAL